MVAFRLSKTPRTYVAHSDILRRLQFQLRYNCATGVAQIPFCSRWLQNYFSIRCPRRNLAHCFLSLHFPILLHTDNRVCDFLTGIKIHERSKDVEHYPKFEWTVSNADRSQQWVVRTDTFDELQEAVQRMNELIPLMKGSSPEKAKETEGQPVCSLHKKLMKLRTAKSGEQWWDHRWKEGDVWYQCNGTDVRTTP